jgi:hypothetical protein
VAEIRVDDDIRARFRDGQGDVREPPDAVHLGEGSRRLPQLTDALWDRRDGELEPPVGRAMPLPF